MTKLINSTYLLAIVIAVAIIVNIPNVSLAQNNQPVQIQNGQTAPQPPQPKGGVATVIGVDQPDNCLRIRSGPGNRYDVIGCARIGETLNITGVWTSNNWAQLTDNGWVYGPQIQTYLRPPPTASSSSRNYVALEYPDYPEDYEFDDYYLPAYGYSTYWYGRIPLFFYDINVWHRFHPWGKNRSHRVWNQGTGRTTTANVNTGAQRNFSTNRSTVAPSNVTRFNSSAVSPGTANRIRSGQTFTGPGAARTLSTPNTARTLSSPGTARTFSNSGTVRKFSNSGSARTFSRSGSARTFSSPSTAGTGKSLGATSFRSPGVARSGSVNLKGAAGNFGGVAGAGAGKERRK